jgi:hypothetical protein
MRLLKGEVTPEAILHSRARGQPPFEAAGKTAAGNPFG